MLATHFHTAMNPVINPNQPIRDTHHKIAAWIQTVLAGICLLGSLFWLLFVVVMGMVSFSGSSYDHPLGFFEFVTSLLGLILIGNLVFSAFFLLGAIQWLRGSERFIVLITIACVIELLIFPVLTFVGAYTLWVLYREPKDAVLPPA